MSSAIKPLKFNGSWELSPSIESTDHLSLKNKCGLFINGKFVNPLSKVFSNYKSI